MLTANDILAYDRSFGRLCEEAEHAFKNGDYFAALACLFVVAENIAKYKLNKLSGKFHDSLVEGLNLGEFSSEEYSALSELKKVRNKLFHENHDSLFCLINGIKYPVDEDETKKLLYEIFQPSIFILVQQTFKNQKTKNED